MSRPSGSTAWLDLLEQMSVCARDLRSALATVLGAQGLTLAELLVLWSSPRGTDAGMAQTDLAARQGASAAQMSGLVEALRRRGWLESQRDPLDRRRQLWRLTIAGEQALATALAALERQTARLDPELPDALLAVLRRLVWGLGSLSCERRGAA